MARESIKALVCSCGRVMPVRERDEETGRYTDEWCGHIGTGVETIFHPQSVVDGLFECAIGNDDHDPRCGGVCAPCGGLGGIEVYTCLICGGDGNCAGCSVGFHLRVARRELAELRSAVISNG